MTLLERINPQIKKIAVSDIRQFDALVTKIPDIIKLTLGEPDFTTPEHVKEAGITAIKENYTHYTGMSGLSELRSAASSFMQDRYHIRYDPQTEILATIGATEAISATLFTVLEPHDFIIVPTPIYPGYLPLITMIGAQPIFIDTTENDFVLTPAMIEQVMSKYGDLIKAIILNYPANPTGITYSREQVQALSQCLAKYDVFVISDEIYSELTYDQDHVSMGEYLFDQTIVINGLSKSHSMTGWRIGFSCAPKLITEQILKTHQYLVTAATSISQKAAVEALNNGRNDPGQMMVEYQKRRDYVCQEMSNFGFKTNKPQGTFYLFAKIPADFNQNSTQFCLDLAKNARVALIPGSAFGSAGEGYVRLSFAADFSKIKTAMERIGNYLR